MSIDSTETTQSSPTMSEGSSPGCLTLFLVAPLYMVKGHYMYVSTAYFSYAILRNCQML